MTDKIIDEKNSEVRADELNKEKLEGVTGGVDVISGKKRPIVVSEKLSNLVSADDMEESSSGEKSADKTGIMV